VAGAARVAVRAADSCNWQKERIKMHKEGKCHAVPNFTTSNTVTRAGHEEAQADRFMAVYFLS
jgi:hypothetical protein